MNPAIVSARSGWVVQRDPRLTVIGPVRDGPYPDNLLPQTVAVHLDDDEVVRVLRHVRTRLHQVFETDALCRTRGQIGAHFGLTSIRIDGGTAAARDDMIHPVGCVPVAIPLDPVLVEVIVTGDGHADVVPSKKRAVQVSHRRGLNFDVIGRA